MSKRSKRKLEPKPPHRWLLVLLFAVLAACVAVLWLRNRVPPIPPGALEGSNLLFVTIDTLRADRLGSYGGPEGLTPHLDRLAAEGIRFERVYAHVPVTLPSHSSIFTARYPLDHGVHDNGTFRLDGEVPTLATVLKEAGYRTGAFVSAFVLDARFGLRRGFDVYDDYYGEKRARLSFTQLERRAEAAVSPAERWIRAQDAPWFAWVHLFDPHAPYEAPRSVPGTDAYGAEIAYTDSVLGAFLERLRLSGRLEHALVVVLGDHGESLGDHGERTHGTFAYDATLRVPWILWSPAGLSPRVFADPVRHVDVMPTVLDLLGIEAPAGIRGQSLRPFLDGEPYSAPPSYFEALNPNLTRDWAPLRGVVAEGYKLIDLPIPELYDLTRDPGEKRNLYRERPEIAHRLEGKLTELTEGEASVEAALPNRETVEKLRALGYLSAPVTERKSDYTAADDPKKLIDVANAYDDVTALFGKGAFDEALPVLEGIVSREPRSSEAYQGLAYALYQLGRLEEAIGTLERGVDRGVQDVKLLSMLGAYLLDAGRVPKAAGILETVVERAPDYAEAHNTLGIAYGRLGRFEKARKEFDEVLALDPSSASTYNNLGRLALARGDAAAAVAALTEALKFDPSNANTYNGLGVAHARQGDTASAVAAWKKAVEANPAHFDALYNLAMALAETSPREALPYLERFVREAPPRRYRADIAQARARIAALERM